MNELVLAWVFLGAVLAGGALLVYGTRVFLDRRRTAALTLAAQQMGFAYEHDGTPFPSGPPAVHLFNVGRNRKFQHVLRGRTVGMEVSLFDYKYTIGNRKKPAHAWADSCRLSPAAFLRQLPFVEGQLERHRQRLVWGTKH